MKHFTAILYLLGQIYSLQISGSTTTKRELYYRNLELFSTQTESDTALNDISYMLGYPLWKIGVLSSPKGLIAGDLRLVYEEKEILYTKNKVMTVPADLADIKDLSSDASLILIIEKDTVFQRLIDDGIFTKFDQSIILITVRNLIISCLS